MGPDPNLLRELELLRAENARLRAREAEHRALEEMLRASEERLRTVVESTPVILFALDQHGVFTLSEGKGLEVLGLRPGEVVGQSALEMYRDHPEVVASLRRALAGEVVRYVGTSGRLAFDVRYVPQRDAQGRVTGVIGAAFDITPLREAAEAQRHAERKYRAVFDNAIEGIFQCRPDGRLLTVNQALARMLGFESPEALLQEAPDLFVLLTRDGQMCGQLVDTMRARGFVVGLEVAARRQDGQPLWLSCNIRAVRDDRSDVALYEGTLVDISERKRLEEQLLQSRKLEAIGRLAGGIAHDFNNLLTAILSYADLVAGALPPGDPLRDDVAEIQRASQRAAELTGQLLSFARRQIIQPRVIDLRELVHTMERMLGRIIGEDVALVTVEAREPAPVRVDPGQFEQILVNLAINARDAMPRGGRLTIEVRNVERYGDDPEAGPEAPEPPYVLLLVSDTGVGMTEEVRRHLFEPFFSTKEPGHGSGLGLATCYGIVQQAGGQIAVRSAPGQGATFAIRLPRADERQIRPMGEAQARRTSGGSETILLVEDEPVLRQIGERALGLWGYRVLSAASAAEALAAARAFPGPIHLLATDVVMPDLNGLQLAAELRAERPELQVLYLSGYAEDAVVRFGLEESRVPLLPKPFTPATLARKVREVLDR